MSKVFIEESTLTAIGDSIRTKTGKQNLISPLNMPTEIESIKGGNIIKTVSGTCPITLENCVEGNLLDYKIYGTEGGVGGFNRLNHSGANAGYIEVEYIESNGTQYIDTGYIPTENTRVDLKWLATDISSSQAVIGCDWNGNAMLLNIQSNTWYFHGPGTRAIAPSLTNPDIISFGAAANSFVINGVTYNNAKDNLSNAKTNMKIFGLDSNRSNTKGKLYYLTIYEGDTPIHEYVPVIKESTCGLWDNVTNEFIISSNTKAFTSGPTTCIVPIKVNDNIYNAKLVSSLNNGDYLDYENRCIVKSDGTKTYLDLPELPLIEGTNTFNVETTVKPSNVSLTYIKSVEFNIMKTVEGTLPLTVEGVGQKLEDYNVYGAGDGGALHYGPNNEYIAYNYITTYQRSNGITNKVGFNSGIQWKNVNKFRFSIRNNTTQENNMIFAAKATNENVCSALVGPWIGLGQTNYQSNAITNLTSENHPEPGIFGTDTLTFTVPTNVSENYIWVASWMDGAWSRDNDWEFVEFYKDDALVAAFYPAKRVSDNIFGFYNTVSGDFITCNANENAFVGNKELLNAVGNKTKNLFDISFADFKSSTFPFERNDFQLSFGNNDSSANYFSTSNLSAFNLEPNKTYTSRCKITETVITSGGSTAGSMMKSIYWQDNNTYSSNAKIAIVNGYSSSAASDGYYYTAFTAPSDISSLQYFVVRLTGYTNLIIEELMIVEGAYDASNFPEYVPYGYAVPFKVNTSAYNLFVHEPLSTLDYIDYENRVVVKNGVMSYIDLPEIYLQNGQNIIDVDTEVKPSKISVSFVDNIFDPSHIITKSTEISCENTGTLYNSACEQVIKSPIITNPTGTYLYHWNQLNDNGYISKPTTQNGVTFTNVGNGKIVLSGTSTNRVLMPVVSSSLMSAWDASHKYYLRKLHSVSSDSTIYWHTYNKLVVSEIALGSTMNFAANYPRVSIAPNYDTTGIEITPQIFDLTAMFGEGNEPTMEQFDAMFPESYYPFNTGVDIYNMPITINGIVNDITCADNGTGYIPKEKIIIPEGDVDISLQGTLSGTYLQTVSA